MKQTDDFISFAILLPNEPNYVLLPPQARIMILLGSISKKLLSLLLNNNNVENTNNSVSNLLFT